jgi:nitroreductase
MQNMMLAAKALEYNSSPMIGYDIVKVAELINLPDDYVMGPMPAFWQEGQGGLAQVRAVALK